MDIAIEQMRVAETSEMVAKSIQEMQLGRDIGVIVLAIRRADGRMIFNPTADAAMHAGDYLIVMGSQENLRTLENLVAERKGARKG
jgi:voltage-gated potassium channel